MLKLTPDPWTGPVFTQLFSSSISKTCKDFHLFCFPSTTHLFQAHCFSSCAKKGQNPMEICIILNRMWSTSWSKLKVGYQGLFSWKHTFQRALEELSTEKMGWGGLFIRWRTFGKKICIPLNPFLKDTCTFREHECRKDISVTLVNPVFPHSFHQEAHVSYLTSINIHRKVGDITSLGNKFGKCWFKWPTQPHPLVKARGGGGCAEAPDLVHGYSWALSTPGPPPLPLLVS